MARVAVLVSRRSDVLSALIQSAVTMPLELHCHERVEGLLKERYQNPRCVVLDVASIGAGELRSASALRSFFDGARWIAIARDGSDQIRPVLDCRVDRLILDPIDLEYAVKEFRDALSSPVPHSTDPLEALTVFLRGASHEIRNPLMAVSGMLQLLSHDADEGERKERYRTMLAEVDRIQQAMDELEQFTRIRKPQRDWVTGAELVDRLRDHPGLADLAVRPSIPAGQHLPRILVDPVLLTEALVELVRFAAGPDQKGAVVLDLQAAELAVHIEIRGVAPVALPDPAVDLFIPYHESSGPGPVGGLRLAAAHGILRAHRGQVEVFRGPQAGVCFRILLPAGGVASESAD